MKKAVKLILIGSAIANTHCSSRPEAPYGKVSKSLKGNPEATTTSSKQTEDRSTVDQSLDSQKESSPNTDGNASGTVSIATELLAPANSGNYAPNHLRAIWISDSAGKRIKTLSANPGTRPFHLRRWQKATAETLDGFTGATVTSYGESNLQITWDLVDQQGMPVTQGSYQLWFELTESNTNDSFVDGDSGYAIYKVDFEIGPETSSITNDNHPVFTQITISHTP